MVTINTVHPLYAERVNRRKLSPFAEIWDALDSVYDPELPGLSIWDLGVLQDIQKINQSWIIEITLTYSGCPAVEMIKSDIISTLSQSNQLNIDCDNINVKISLKTAWTTELISPQGLKQLRTLNIAPPVENEQNIHCPNCNSLHTQVISDYGSTACKSLRRCIDCLEPFDYFKLHI